jgi:tricorn protease
MKLFSRFVAFAIALSFMPAAFALDDARLLRFPDINKDLVAFVYAGDIWTVEATGGNARRLTSHEGLELFPKISPDGKWIAFSGEYSGSRQVFIIPSTGGTPKQLTFYNSVGVMPPRGGWDNAVLDWTPDSKQVMFRGNRTHLGERNGKYFLVSIDGGLETPLEIVNGGFAASVTRCIKICFTPVDREFRTWKRYKGGRATDLWIYDLKNHSSDQITNFTGADQWPVWFGNNIFYASDQDLKLNIYKYDIASRQAEQMTFHKDFDVMWPSGENGQLVYENGGYLYKLNLNTGANEKLVVNINFDNPNLIPYFKNVKEHIGSFDISPTGKRAIFDARGDIFSVPAEHGEIENLTNTQGVRELYPSWSPNGKYITYVSDASGEYEIYLLENKKGAEAKQLSSGSKAWKYMPVWSPDSKYIAFSDRNMKLWLIDVATGKQQEVNTATMNEIRDYIFSPDSRWITYTREGNNGLSAIWVYNLETSKNTQLTDNTFNDWSPVFSRDGKYLFFASDRDFNLQFSSFEFDYLYTKATRLYAMVLSKDGPALVKKKVDVEPAGEPEEPEVSASADKSNQNGKNNNGKNGNTDAVKPAKKEPVKVVIDFENINHRIAVLPVESGDYGNLMAAEGGLLYASDNKLMFYNQEEEKSVEILDKTGNASVSADGKMLIYKSGQDYGIVKVKEGQKVPAGKLNLENLEMKIDPRKEWNQIYTDAWRIFRDFFYVNNLHGVDWIEIKERYSPLLPSVAHRADLDYVLSEIVAESNTGHAYVDWGDFNKVKRVEGGLLGAEIIADHKAGMYKIGTIYDSENWNKSRRSPLRDIGVNVNEGDYIISINGRKLTLNDNPYEFLENSIDRNIELEVNSKADAKGSRIETIKPINSEHELMYLHWVNERRALVDKLSDGRIGYIHVPNTAVEGNRELYRGMYTYHDKEALIIDDRYNGGGFIPDRMADLLDRRTLSYWHRNGLQPGKAPGVAHDGPKAMLINGYSSSGGDAFPYYFKKLGLGKLIGTRTWGGLVGISRNAGLVDGGYIAVPRFGIFDENEQWIIEGIGVYPDIEVVDRPEQLATGKDAVIERAVNELLQELKDKPLRKVNSPVPPNRSQWIEYDIK